MSDALARHTTRPEAARRLPLAGIAFTVVSAAGFSLQGLFTKLAYQAGASATTIGFGRFALATLVLWAYCLFRRWRAGFPLRLPRHSTIALLLLGAIGYFLGAMTYIGAIAYIPVSLAGLLLYTYPAIATVLALALGQERVSRGLGVGLTITLVGVAVTLGIPALVATHHNDWRGIVLVLASAALYSGYIVGSEQTLHGIHTMLAMAYIATGALISFGLLTLLTGTFTPAIGLGGWSWIAAIALMSTVLAAGAFLAGLRRLGPARAATLSTVEPIFTVVFAGIFLGERLSLFQLLGGLVILLGVFTVIQERSKPASEPVP